MLLCLGCDEARRANVGAPPPEGYPLLAARFEVDVEVLSADCAFAGFGISDARFEAKTRLDGIRVDWYQPADGERLLTGALCKIGEAFHVRLRGGQTTREARGDLICEVRSAYAPSPCSGYSAAICVEQPGCALLGSRCAVVADVCEDPHAVDLKVEACGALSGIFEMEVDARRGCPSEACRVRLRWRATPEGGVCD